MEKLKSEINRVRSRNLHYYNSHLDIVESYIEEKPDISIETCKALIEGISKLALHVVNGEGISSHKNEDIQPLFKRALTELQKGRGFSDRDLCNRLGSVVHHIGEIRNAHGDISHGRASLQEQVNDADFADLVIGVTDSLCTYMLRRIDIGAVPVIEYEENEEFNSELDEQNPLPGKVKYSRALYEQEPETYEIMLEDYKIENDDEEV